MGRHAWIELGHIAAQLATTALFAWLAAWAVPQAAEDVWIVALLAMLAVAFMGIRPFRLGLAADRAEPPGTATRQ